MRLLPPTFTREKAEAALVISKSTVIIILKVEALWDRGTWERRLQCHIFILANYCEKFKLSLFEDLVNDLKAEIEARCSTMEHISCDQSLLHAQQ
jgi:hypothetical protein